MATKLACGRLQFGDDARVDGARLDHLGLQVLVETLRKYWHPSAQPLDSCKESDERGVLEDPEVCVPLCSCLRVPRLNCRTISHAEQE